jgi:hypothetical protein
VLRYLYLNTLRQWDSSRSCDVDTGSCPNCLWALYISTQMLPALNPPVVPPLPKLFRLTLRIERTLVKDVLRGSRALSVPSWNQRCLKTIFFKSRLALDILPADFWHYTPAHHFIARPDFCMSTITLICAI